MSQSYLSYQLRVSLSILFLLCIITYSYHCRYLSMIGLCYLYYQSSCIFCINWEYLSIIILTTTKLIAIFLFKLPEEINVLYIKNKKCMRSSDFLAGKLSRSCDFTVAQLLSCVGLFKEFCKSWITPCQCNIFYKSAREVLLWFFHSSFITVPIFLYHSLMTLLFLIFP